MAEKNLAVVKKSFEKMGIHYDNDGDYLEAWHNLVGYFDVLIEMDMEQKRKQADTEKSSDNP